MTELPTYEEVLVMLAEKAGTGSISAMVALERALRPKDHEPDAGSSEIEAELDRLLEES